jgi:uncharacterized protein YecE (DUF72 family)
LTDYLVGTGGWAYFKVPNKPSLKAYSEIFNFVEVNYTFYEYPDTRMVKGWRRSVPDDFTFAVRCHQDLTHRIGLMPADETYSVISRMISYCEILNAPFLILETPASYSIIHDNVERAKDFFSSLTLKGVRLVWEVRSSLTPAILNLMRDFNIIESVDLSTGTPIVESDVIYSRLFGKGKHNIYQFTDEELSGVDRQIERLNPRIAALSYHGARMNIDAARYTQYKKYGKFIPATNFTGVDSARAVLLEDAEFPLSKMELIENQGWKVVDLTLDHRVHLSELLYKVPNKTYNCINDVVKALEAIV